MAAKFTISSLLFLLLIACQDRPTSQLDILNLPPSGWCYGFLSYPASEWEYKRDVEVAIDLEAIVKALYDRGYQTASNIFEKDLGAILGVRYNLENSTTVMGNTTIFVPRDDAFKNRSSIDFEPQIVRSLMLDREALHSSTLPVKTLFAIRGARDYLSVTQKPTDSHGHVSINNVTITDLDIYHNGRVVVHGVEDFFGSYFVFKNPPPNHEASVYCKMLLLSFVVLASTYINAAATAANFAKPRRIVTRLIHRDSVISPFYVANATASDHARLAIENSEAASPLYTSGSEIMAAWMTWGLKSLQQIRGCEDKVNPIYDPAKSYTYANLSCDSAYCAPSIRGTCGPNSTCIYSLGYRDNANSTGCLASETFNFMTFDEDTQDVPDLVFGCGNHNFDNVEQSNGVLGLGADIYSLVPQLGSMFSYCIGSIKDPFYAHNKLILGEGANIEGLATPLDIYRGFYYLTLEGISVGRNCLNIDRKTFTRSPAGDGGVVIDSGTTLSSLVRGAYEPLKEEVEHYIGKSLSRAFLYEDVDRLCYTGIISRDLVGFPTVTLNFASEANLEIDKDGLFHQREQNIFCMAIKLANETTKPRNLSIIGALAQQHHNIAYDISERELTIKRTDCQLVSDIAIKP
ncbi:hypothetical protein RJ639_029954 [Escallonia herrerae]|uniref:Peptidase A1 domain-containing protein n=1 Tax=Escallonia herrerae TaxID=1293975 RepID=A0AA88X719_9ASTE|nr:hypothetical protein RJ639_029954 [Escallonia herrerae]